MCLENNRNMTSRLGNWGIHKNYNKVLLLFRIHRSDIIFSIITVHHIILNINKTYLVDYILIM